MMLSPAYKLRRSRLRPSLLLTLRMTPILKNFSSPAAVLPPIYHLSAPSASRKPSLLLSLPLLRELGIGMGPPGEPRGVWMATLVDDVVAAFVEIARAAEDVVEDAAAADVEAAAAAAAAADAEAACDVCLVAC